MIVKMPGSGPGIFSFLDDDRNMKAGWALQ
jgi:hypothetical protein